MRVLSCIRQFLADRQGAYAIMYALAAAPILLGVGLAIDYRNSQLALAELQEALDSAMLAATRKYSEEAGKAEADRKAEAEAAGRSVFEENLTNALVKADSSDISFAFNGDSVEVRANVKGSADLLFGDLFGMEKLELSASGAARGADRRRVEVILALDNTGSMTSVSSGSSESRMRLMRAAAHNFVDYLFDYGVEDKLYVGVVPWSNTVNLAFETPSNTWTDAAWNHNKSLGNGGTGTNTWPRPSTQFMNDHAVMPRMFRTFTLRGGQRLSAAPLTIPAGVKVGVDTSPRDNIDDALGVGLTNDLSYSTKNNTTLLKEATNNRDWLGCVRAGDNERGNNSSGVVTQALTDAAPAGGLLWQPYILEEGVSGAGNSTSDRQPSCSSPVLPLSGSRAQIKQTLERMRADGNTYQDIGLTWALRLLSPRTEWTTFFRYGSKNRPAAFDVSKTRKVIVLLTDGENVASNDREQYYGCTQNVGEQSDNARNYNSNGSWSWRRRSGAGGCWRAAGLSRIDNGSLDNLLLDACTQIRSAYNIELYAIAVDITNTNAIRLLNRCAGGTDSYTHPRFENIRGSEINSVLLAIAQESLRIIE